MVEFTDRRKETDEMIKLRDQLIRIAKEIYPDGEIGTGGPTYFRVGGSKLEVGLDYTNTNRIRMVSFDEAHNPDNYRKTDAYRLAERFEQSTGRTVEFVIDYGTESRYESMGLIKDMEERVREFSKQMGRDNQYTGRSLKELRKLRDKLKEAK